MTFYIPSYRLIILTAYAGAILFLDPNVSVHSSFIPNLPQRRILPVPSTCTKWGFFMGRTVSSSSSLEAVEAADPTPRYDPRAPYTLGETVILLPWNAETVLSKFGQNSPFGTPTLLEAAKHLSRKAYFFSNATVMVHVAMIHHHHDENDNQKHIRLLTPSPFQVWELQQQQHQSPSNIHTDRHFELQQQPQLETQLADADFLFSADTLIAMSIQQTSDVMFLQNIIRKRNAMIREQGHKNKCHLFLDCNNMSSSPRTEDPVLDELVATYQPQHASLISQILVSLPFTKQASAKRLYYKMKSLLQRWTSDDFTVALMLFFNQYPTVRHVPSSSSLSNKIVDDPHWTPHIDWVKHSIDATWDKGPIRNIREFYSMITKCGSCIGQCMSDAQCRECITKLSTIDTRDQVESYRTIVSYDGSDLLKDFSLCILQKNNIFQCDAKIPTLPKVEPLKVWRGIPLTHDVAQNLLIGHLNEETALEGSLHGSISWKVAAGANVAYDQFPSQNQLFYKGIGKTMWYDPIFRVKTIDGRDIWCKRHYRVRTGPIPGTFRFSVLDNGVTSDEYWTIVAVDDNLQWIIFHYAGAASAVGLQYLGGLLCTIDGSLPNESDREKIWNKLRSAGIEPWELFAVDNDAQSTALLAAGPPPLDFYRSDVKREINKVESNRNNR